jgi:hypothetical protein
LHTIKHANLTYRDLIVSVAGYSDYFCDLSEACRKKSSPAWNINHFKTAGRNDIPTCCFILVRWKNCEYIMIGIQTMMQKIPADYYQRVFIWKHSE